MYFQELFIWLAQEHHLSQLIDAPGGSCWLLEPLWASMVALGGSWRKYMKAIVLLQGRCFWFPRAILNVSQDVYSGWFKMHEDYRFVDFWIQGQKTIKSSLMGWFWSLLGPRLERHDTILHQKTFWYRIIVHWVICSCVLRQLLTEPAGDPRKICVYAKVFP